jgi:hypothetical protein
MYPKIGEYPKDENVKPDPIAQKTTDAILATVQFILDTQIDSQRYATAICPYILSISRNFEYSYDNCW